MVAICRICVPWCCFNESGYGFAFVLTGGGLGSFHPRLNTINTCAYVKVIAVSNTGKIFIIWHAANLTYTTSDNGTSWANPKPIGRDYGGDQPASISANSSGKVAVAFARPGGNPFDIVVGIWNGNNFDLEVVTRGNMAEPSITITQGGTYVVAWRQVDGGL